MSNSNDAIDEKQKEVTLAMKNVDALIIDSSYTPEEYATKRRLGTRHL